MAHAGGMRENSLCKPCTCLTDIRTSHSRHSILLAHCMLATLVHQNCGARREFAPSQRARLVVSGDLGQFEKFLLEGLAFGIVLELAQRRGKHAVLEGQVLA